MTEPKANIDYAHMINCKNKEIAELKELLSISLQFLDTIEGDIIINKGDYLFKHMDTIKKLLEVKE